MENHGLQNGKLIIDGYGAEIYGVTSVLNYGEREVAFKVGERKLVVSGFEITCEKIDVENGFAKIKGKINSARYTDHTSLIKKFTK